MDNKIAIVGAGIMGRLLAWKLNQQGIDVTIFDKDPVDNGSACSYTAAGMLTPYSEIESADKLIFNMGLRSLQLWKDFFKQQNLDGSFYQRGSLIVAHQLDQPELSHFNQQVLHKLSPSPSQFQLLDQPQLAQLEPQLAGQETT